KSHQNQRAGEHSSPLRLERQTPLYIFSPPQNKALFAVFFAIHIIIYINIYKTVEKVFGLC
ncbi:MAG: hypothetical protein ACI4LI_03375, partial [Candidatus Fimenecus sp.]